MHFSHELLTLCRRLAAIAIVGACLTSLGCAGSSAWADDEADKAVQTVAADDSFPSAAEVGLATASTARSDPR